MNRAGRRPLGFLSLICKSSNSEPGEDAKGNGQRLQKPLIAASKQSLKRPTPSAENNTDTQESCSLPSTSLLTSAECENIGTAAVQVRRVTSEHHVCMKCKALLGDNHLCVCKVTTVTFFYRFVDSLLICMP